MGTSSQKKDDHIFLCMSERTTSTATTGFEDYVLEHTALPELNFSDIDISTKFFGRKLSMPLMISSMTGGGRLSDKINKALAELANDFNICLSVGSQKCAFEDDSARRSFQKLRTYAPNIPVISNLGASQLNYGFGLDECRKAVDMIDADAFTFHLNPLHEVFQANGTTNFSNLLSKIEKICDKIGVPVIVKEVGYGISVPVAKKLIDAGVSMIDVAGAGSISWTEVEKERSNDIIIRESAKSFIDWGIPTAQCIKAIAENVEDARIIASGGVNTGVKMAKAIALGASLCGNASEFLRSVIESRSSCENYLETLKFELKTAMFCTGSRNISELKHAGICKSHKSCCNNR